MIAWTTLLVILMATSGFSVAIAESHSATRSAIAIAFFLFPRIGGYVRSTLLRILQISTWPAPDSPPTYRIETRPSNSASRNHPCLSATLHKCRVIISYRSLPSSSSSDSESTSTSLPLSLSSEALLLPLALAA